MRYARVLLLGLAALVAFLLVPRAPASAATFTVNSTADAVDASPGNGVCATAGGQCTLRAAIQEANALAGTDATTLPAGTYALTIAGAGEDAATTGRSDGIDNDGDTVIDESGEGANDENPDLWPPDADDDEDSDVGDIIALFFGKIFNPPAYSSRSDADGDLDNDVGDVVAIFLGKVFTRCA